MHQLLELYLFHLHHILYLNPHLHQIIGAKELSKYSLPKVSFGVSQSLGDADTVCGVSSFAFQGTNSHALLGCRSFSLYSKEDVILNWQPKRCWVVPPVHPLLTSFAGSDAELGTVEFQTNLTKALHSYLWDHQIQKRPLYPGAGYLEMGTALGHIMTDGVFESIVVAKASIPAPLVLSQSMGGLEANIVKLRLNTMQNSQFSISSSSTRAGVSIAMEHFRASLCWLHSMSAEQHETSALCVATEALRARSVVPVSSSLMYAAMHGVGLDYLPRFQVLRSIRHEGTSSGQACAEIGGQVDSELSGLYTHPSALDGCLQLGATSLAQKSTLGKEEQQTQVPAGIDAFTVQSKTRSVALRAAAKTTFSSAEKSISQHALLDPNGLCSSTVCGLLTKSMASGASAASASRAAMQEQRSSMAYFVQWSACIAQVSGSSVCADAHSQVSLKSET